MTDPTRGFVSARAGVGTRWVQLALVGAFLVVFLGRSGLPSPDGFTWALAAVIVGSVGWQTWRTATDQLELTPQGRLTWRTRIGEDRQVELSRLTAVSTEHRVRRRSGGRRSSGRTTVRRLLTLTDADGRTLELEPTHWRERDALIDAVRITVAAGGVAVSGDGLFDLAAHDPAGGPAPPEAGPHHDGATPPAGASRPGAAVGERASSSAAHARRRPPALGIVSLVGMNLVPLFGVLLFDWSVVVVLVVYWLENGIVGLLNVVRILAARGEPAPDQTTGISLGAQADAWAEQGWVRLLLRMGMSAFFVVHYGIFWVVHGAFVALIAVFIASEEGLLAEGPTGQIDLGGLPVGGLVVAALTLLASHVVSLIVNYFGREEYRRISPQSQMMQPYGRVVVLHLVVMAGGALAATVGGAALVALLVVLKTAVDLGFHLREHAKDAA